MLVALIEISLYKKGCNPPLSFSHRQAPPSTKTEPKYARSHTHSGAYFCYFFLFFIKLAVLSIKKYQQRNIIFTIKVKYFKERFFVLSGVKI